MGGAPSSVWLPRSPYGRDLARNQEVLGGFGRGMGVNASGVAWAGTSAATSHWLLPKGEETSRAITVVWHGIWKAGDGVLLRDFTSGGGLIPVWRNAGAYDLRLGGTDYTAAGSWPAGVPVTVVVTASGTYARLWANGKLQINGGAPALASVNTQWVLGRNGALANYATQDTNLLAIIPRTMADDVCIELSENPWALFEDEPEILVFSGSAGTPTGTAAPTEAADTSTASGFPVTTGSVAATQGADTSSASGTTAVVGTSAATEGADTCAASGSVSGAPVGTAAVTEAADTASASGTTAVVGTSAATQGADTSSAAGSPIIVGTVSVTQAADTCSATDNATVTGTCAIAARADTCIAIGEPWAWIRQARASDGFSRVSRVSTTWTEQ